MFKPFYVHDVRHTGPYGNSKDRHQQRRAFTASIKPVEKDPRMCQVALAYCSWKDSFVKKAGRKAADDHPFITINKRDLPSVLASARSTCFNDSVHESAFYYILKYVV
jgi:hypothetical protein